MFQLLAGIGTGAAGHGPTGVYTGCPVTDGRKARERWSCSIGTEGCQTCRKGHAQQGKSGTALVGQRLTAHAPVQGTQV